MQQVAIARITCIKIKKRSNRKVIRMEDKKIHRRTAFVAALFVISVFVLGLKMLNPTPIQIVIEGQNASITQLPGFFTAQDVALVAVASILLE